MLIITTAYAIVALGATGLIVFVIARVTVGTKYAWASLVIVCNNVVRLWTRLGFPGAGQFGHNVFTVAPGAGSLTK